MLRAIGASMLAFATLGLVVGVSQGSSAPIRALQGNSPGPHELSTRAAIFSPPSATSCRGRYIIRIYRGRGTRGRIITTRHRAANLCQRRVGSRGWTAGIVVNNYVRMPSGQATICMVAWTRLRGNRAPRHASCIVRSIR